MPAPRAKHDRKVDQAGYVRVRTETGWRFEHIVVAEQVLGRALADDERVYHRSTNRADNRPQNLVVGPSGIGRAVQVLDALIVLADLCENTSTERTVCCCDLREAKRRRDREYRRRQRARAKAAA